MAPLAPSGRRPVAAVLLSTYNGAAHLAEQLDSLAAQQDVTVRLHVRDDGSTDETRAVLRRYADVWPNLGKVRPARNRGAAASFLELLRTAPDDADIYAFCDQDDVWLPRKLARAAEALAGDHGPALYCSNYLCVAGDLTPLGTPAPHQDVRLEHLLFENIATGCTVVVNREARALINSRRARTGVVMHDWWCALVVAACGRIHYDPEPTVLYRQHGQNVVGSSASRFGQAVQNAARLLKAPDRFYQIHGQAAQLLKLYGGLMNETEVRTVLALVGSRRTLRDRARYVLRGHVRRRRFADAMMVRLLIMADRY